MARLQRSRLRSIGPPPPSRRDPSSDKEPLLPEPVPPLHLRLRDRVEQTTERLALRAALTASHLLGLATGHHLRELRAHADPIVQLQARLEQAELCARLAWETAEMLGARFARIEERRRPYYTPGQRFRILEIKSLLAWSAVETARAFLVCPNTILNWERAADPHAATVGCTIKPTPPVRRAADVVRATVQALSRVGVGGQDLLARILARAGWRVSSRSIARYRKERVAPVAPATAALPKRSMRPVRAGFVHHVWMMDVSEVKRLLGPPLQVAAVFDAFARLPLAVEVFETRPSAAQMARLLRRAARVFSAPKYLITDLGGEFTGKDFRRVARRLGIIQRFGAKENLYATARLERFWRTLKEMAGLYGLSRPVTVDDLEHRLGLALLHYLAFRPHEGLGGATPFEVFTGVRPAHRDALEPPRGGPGEDVALAPLHVDALDGPDDRFVIVEAPPITL